MLLLGMMALEWPKPLLLLRLISSLHGRREEGTTCSCEGSAREGTLRQADCEDAGTCVGGRREAQPGIREVPHSQ